MTFTSPQPRPSAQRLVNLKLFHERQQQSSNPPPLPLTSPEGVEHQPQGIHSISEHLSPLTAQVPPSRFQGHAPALLPTRPPHRDPSLSCHNNMAWVARLPPRSIFFGRPSLLPTSLTNSTSHQYLSSLPQRGEYRLNTTLRPTQSQSSPFSNDLSGRIVRLLLHDENNQVVPKSAPAIETAVTQTPLLGILQMPKDVKTVPTLFVKTSSAILSTGGKTSPVIHTRIAAVLANVPSTLIRI